MVERAYKCTLCHASFRNESGMMWHVSRRHEAPQALEALGKNYNGKLEQLRNENTAQEHKNNDLNTRLDDAMMKLLNANLSLIKERQDNISLMTRIRDMENEQQKFAIALVLRDQILKQRLGIELPNPFGDSDKNSKNPSQH